MAIKDHPDARVAEFKLGDAPAPGTEVTLGIRPEHFSGKGRTKLDIRVDAVENLGGTAYAYSRTGGEAPLTIEMKTERGVREGKTLDIGFDAKQAFLFDRRSGERIR